MFWVHWEVAVASDAGAGNEAINAGATHTHGLGSTVVGNV